MYKYIFLISLFNMCYAQTLCNCICPASTTTIPTTTTVITTTTTTVPEVSPTTTSIWKPKGVLDWYIQYAGTIDYNKNVDVYNVDLEGTSVQNIKKLQDRGVKVICYISAGTFEDYRDDASDFLHSDIGNKMDGWPENWLDIRSTNVRNIMKKRMLLAKTKGCNSIDTDNVDGYDNDSGFPLTYADQLDYNKFLANYAHSIGLSISLKNNLEQVKDLVNFFDFSINEECSQWDECNLLNPFVLQNKSVFHIEYVGSCKYIKGFSSIIKKMSLNAYQINC